MFILCGARKLPGNMLLTLLQEYGVVRIVVDEFLHCEGHKNRRRSTSRLHFMVRRKIGNLDFVKMQFDPECASATSVVTFSLWKTVWEILELNVFSKLHLLAVTQLKRKKHIH